MSFTSPRLFQFLYLISSRTKRSVLKIVVIIKKKLDPKSISIDAYVSRSILAIATSITLRKLLFCQFHVKSNFILFNFSETLNRWVNWDKNESGFQSWKTEI